MIDRNPAILLVTLVLGFVMGIAAWPEPVRPVVEIEPVPGHCYTIQSTGETTCIEAIEADGDA